MRLVLATPRHVQAVCQRSLISYSRDKNFLSEFSLCNSWAQLEGNRRGDSTAGQVAKQQEIKCSKMGAIASAIIIQMLDIAVV